LNRTWFIWDSNRAQMDLKMLGHGSQGTAGSKGIKGCISVHWSTRGGKHSGRIICNSFMHFNKEF